MGIKLYLDISGQIQQLNLDSALGCISKEGLKLSAYLRSSTKKEIISKYKGQVTNIIEKLHCILIYYCIKDNLKDVREIEICKDVSFRRIKNLLHLLFLDSGYLINIKIIQRESNTYKSLAHRVALKSFRKRKYATILITKEMIENVLFKFRKN